MEIWHWHLAHLNAADIIKMSEDFWSDVIIKDSKILSFCKTCQFISVKKKISRISMPHCKCCGEMFHIDTDGGSQVLDDSENFTLSFLSARYFVLIICNAMHNCWIFFIKNKSDIYDVLVYFFNHIKNHEMRSSAVLQSDWTSEIGSHRCQKLLLNNRTKWKSSVLYS